MAIAIQFTRNGDDTGRIVTDRPFTANDVHFKFKRGKQPPKLKYTKGGTDLPGGEHAAPEGATDVGVEFGADKSGNLIVKQSHWTDKDGEVIGGIDGYIKPPDGADDWHVEVPHGEITEAEWTFNGDTYKPRQMLDVPKHVNDAHLSLHQHGGQAHLAGASAHKTAVAALVGYLLGIMTEGDDEVGARSALRVLVDQLGANRD